MGTLNVSLRKAQRKYSVYINNFVKIYIVTLYVCKLSPFLNAFVHIYAAGMGDISSILHLFISYLSLLSFIDLNFKYVCGYT